MDAWLANTLNNRADSSWAPAVTVSPDLAALHSTIAGYAATADANLRPGVVQVRVAADVFQGGNPVPIYSQGQLAATLIVT